MLSYIQIALAALLITAILVQQTGAGLSETFGGAGAEVGFHTRRGAEKLLLHATIVLSLLFVLSTMAAIAV